MIEKTTAYRVADKHFATLEEAQAHELEVLIRAANSEEPQEVSRHLVAAREKVIDILTTGPRSKVKNRKINGARKTRAPKEEAA